MPNDALRIRTIAVVTTMVVFSLLVPVLAAGESIVVVNVRQPFSIVFFDECTGEDIEVTAEDHVLVLQKVAKDGTPYWEESINTHGIAAGLTSGREYVYNETIRFNRPVEPGPECGFAIDFSTRLRLVSKGTHPDLFVRYVFALDISSSCEAIVTESFESACRP